MLRAPKERRGREGQVGQAESRHDHQRLAHLGEEPQPDEDTDAHHPSPGPLRVQRPRSRASCCHQKEDQQRVRVVVAEDQHRDRGEGEDSPGEQPEARRVREVTHGAHHQGHRGHPGKGLRQQHAERREPQQARRQRHRPQPERGLVHRDRVAGIEGAEEERLPRLGPGLRRRCVVLVAPTRSTARPQVQQRRGTEERPEAHSIGRAMRSRIRGAPRGADARGRGKHCQSDHAAILTVFT